MYTNVYKCGARRDTSNWIKFIHQYTRVLRLPEESINGVKFTKYLILKKSDYNALSKHICYYFFLYRETLYPHIYIYIRSSVASLDR